MFSSKKEIDDYIYKLFKNKTLNSNSLVYFLFMIRAGFAQQLINEKHDFIFDNFGLIILLILENYQQLGNNCNLFLDSILKFNSPKVNKINNIL